MTITETRKRIKFSIELIHQMLDLPEDAVIRDIRFEDVDHGIVTCYYVTHGEDKITEEGEGSIIYTASEKFHRDRGSFRISHITEEDRTRDRFELLTKHMPDIVYH